VVGEEPLKVGKNFPVRLRFLIFLNVKTLFHWKLSENAQFEPIAAGKCS
jgi:hypothetical protein